MDVLPLPSWAHICPQESCRQGLLNAPLTFVSGSSFTGSSFTPAPSLRSTASFTPQGVQSPLGFFLLKLRDNLGSEELRICLNRPEPSAQLIGSTEQNPGQILGPIPASILIETGCAENERVTETGSLKTRVLTRSVSTVAGPLSDKKPICPQSHANGGRLRREPFPLSLPSPMSSDATAGVSVRSPAVPRRVLPRISASGLAPGLNSGLNQERHVVRAR